MAASRTGSSSGALVVSIDDRSITGVREFRRALKQIGPEWPRELRVVHKTIADEVAAAARGRASGMGGVQALAAKSIKGTANQREARIGVSGQVKGRRTSGPIGNVAFWGAEKRTGWYSRYRYKDVPTAQHPTWVGNSWDVGDPSGGPYAINETIAVMKPEIYEQYLQMLENLAERAGFAAGATIF